MPPRAPAARRARRAPQRPFDVALAATTHDPRGGLRRDLERFLPALRSLYRHVAVATSPPTAPALRDALAAAGAWAGTPRSNRRGPLYRLALRAAARSGAARVHYLDLDRVLHWMRRDRRALRAVLRAARRYDVLVVGRTPKAHRSHHLPLYATEDVANRLLCERAGLAGRVDWLVPSFVVTREHAATLLARSRARDATLYGEWPALLLDLAASPAYVECRGLDWETPDRHRRAIRRVGLAAWRRRLETPAEWRLRVDLARAIVAGFSRGPRRQPGAVRLRRLRQR